MRDSLIDLEELERKLRPAGQAPPEPPDVPALLREALAELRDLRRRNELLGAKVEVMDLFACVLFSQPANRGGGMSPDVAWKIEQALKRMAPADRRWPGPPPAEEPIPPPPAEKPIPSPDMQPVRP